MNVFDILGPVMIGPSSSHTAGAARIGKTAALLLGEPVVKADILFHGSFAKTFKGHGSDKAIVGGILKYDPWDPGIRTSLETAGKLGIVIDIHTGIIENAHPNTALVTLTGADGKILSVQGSSIGGGNIEITRINDMEVYFTGQKTTLIVMHQDVPGIIANVTNLVAAGYANICSFRLNRQEKGGIAIMIIETDSDIDPSLVSQIRELSYVYNTILLKLG
ncbi:L-serine ammonia-lyase, iron-sulfur-dependent subunit beta [Clostridium boliviensis]|uniref:L-serine deaminase n=1 Tax=Clostridium boliviensis TaxID=318465 RepID=A0ABU4GP36_9CLOT|nr:L-serine ammonia-lyase, iron-sulfur-dependent subunit beta [Clostridium boliviensis]MDW2799391.1 L-serine ammonia-lyase, iron-sulfur-dependent subunit beta [Clostridium boliviensis]